MALRCRLFMVGTRFCASAARSNAEHTALERQLLPVPLTAFQCDPAKKSTLERGVMWGIIPRTLHQATSPPIAHSSYRSCSTVVHRPS
jgi:hypothetical protein